MGQEINKSKLWLQIRRIAKLDEASSQNASTPGLSREDKARIAEALQASAVEAAKDLIAVACPEEAVARPTAAAPDWTKCLAMGVDVAQGDSGSQSTRLAVVANQDEEPLWIDAAQITQNDFAAMMMVLYQGGRVDVIAPGMPIYSYSAEPGIAASLLADQKAKRDERREREGRDLADQLREAQQWGFRRAKHVALEAVEREWSKFRGYSRPCDVAMSTAVDAIKSITLPKVEG